MVTVCSGELTSADLHSRQHLDLQQQIRSAHLTMLRLQGQGTGVQASCIYKDQVCIINICLLVETIHLLHQSSCAQPFLQASTMSGKGAKGLSSGKGAKGLSKAADRDNKKKPVSRSARAGLQFPVGRIHRLLKVSSSRRRGPAAACGALNNKFDCLTGTCDRKRACRCHSSCLHSSNPR